MEQLGEKKLKKTFLNVIYDYNKKLGSSVNLHSKVLVWSEDYEKSWYLIYDYIPEAAQYFWVNRFGTYLYKFERIRDHWKVVEKGKSLTNKDLKRITIGPAFTEVPPVLEYHPVANNWF